MRIRQRVGALHYKKWLKQAPRALALEAPPQIEEIAEHLLQLEHELEPQIHKLPAEAPRALLALEPVAHKREDKCADERDDKDEVGSAVPQPPPEDDAQIPQLRQHHQKQLVPHHLSYTPQISALIIKTDIEYKLKLAGEIE